MMIHRPLYRWKSVWLGVLVLAFIGWAWVRSMVHLDMMVWTSSSRTQAFYVRSTAAEVRAQGTGPAHALIPLGPGLSRASFPYKTRVASWFPRAVTTAPFDNTGGWDISVGYWVIAVIFFIPYSGFLVWHGWRMRRRVMDAGHLPAVEERE